MSIVTTDPTTTAPTADELVGRARALRERIRELQPEHAQLGTYSPEIHEAFVEAGLYVTAGTKILLPEEPRTADGKPRVVKAMELSGVPGLLFRRNSLSGAVEAITRTGAGVTLNHTLHA